MKNICICGGGNLGHVVTGFLAAQENLKISLLTRRPDKWKRQLCIHTPEGTDLNGTIHRVSSSPEEVVSHADIVLLCLPGFSIPPVLQQIKEFLAPGTAVGSIVSSTGFFFEAIKQLSCSTPLFGFRRVPFIARTTRYGEEANLLGYKKELQVAIEQTDKKEELRKELQEIFRTPILLLNHYLEASLSNSNPLLHPSRLYSLWKDWHKGIVYKRNALFYEEWTDEASQLYIDMDKELQALLHVLPVTPGCIPTVLQYYESSDAESLTRKLRSIKAFQNIKVPVRQVNGGWEPDFESRYFTEDFPYGLHLIQKLAHENGIPTPTMDTVYEWGHSNLQAHHHE